MRGLRMVEHCVSDTSLGEVPGCARALPDLLGGTHAPPLRRREHRDRVRATEKFEEPTARHRLQAVGRARPPHRGGSYLRLMLAGQGVVCARGRGCSTLRRTSPPAAPRRAQGVLDGAHPRLARRRGLSSGYSGRGRTPEHRDPAVVAAVRGAAARASCRTRANPFLSLSWRSYFHALSREVLATPGRVWGWCLLRARAPRRAPWHDL